MSYYDTHKDQWNEYSRKKRYKKKEFIRQLKDKPCADCGGKFPYYVMQFDHVRGEKTLTFRHVAHGTHGKKATYAEIAEEAEKCDVICANCHAIRTWKQANGLPF